MPALLHEDIDRPEGPFHRRDDPHGRRFLAHVENLRDLDANRGDLELSET
jgi:hypothetical protein